MSFHCQPPPSWEPLSTLHQDSLPPMIPGEDSRQLQSPPLWPGCQLTPILASEVVTWLQWGQSGTSIHLAMVITSRMLMWLQMANQKLPWESFWTVGVEEPHFCLLKSWWEEIWGSWYFPSLPQENRLPETEASSWEKLNYGGRFRSTMLSVPLEWGFCPCDKMTSILCHLSHKSPPESQTSVKHPSEKNLPLMASTMKKKN